MPRRVLVVDVGGTHVKILVTGRRTPVKLPSGPGLTPKAMVDEVRAAAADWQYDAVSVGYPGPVRHDKIQLEPWNLGRGWKRFNFQKAFGKPTRIINDAAMQA